MIDCCLIKTVDNFEVLEYGLEFALTLRLWLWASTMDRIRLGSGPSD